MESEKWKISDFVMIGILGQLRFSSFFLYFYHYNKRILDHLSFSISEANRDKKLPGKPVNSERFYYQVIRNSFKQVYFFML